MTRQTDLGGKTIAFDLDGTLVDTAPDLTNSMNYAMNLSGRPTTPIEIVRNKIGHGAKALLGQALQFHQLTVSEPVLEEILSMFLAHYAANSTRHSRTFAGAIDCLRGLRQQGARLTVCTNKPQALTLPILQKLKLSGFFDGVYCADTVPAKKPDAAHVLAAIAPNTAANSLMIGDSQTDLLGAQNAGVDCFLLAHGYSETPVSELGAKRVFANFTGLEAAIIDWF